MTEDKLQNSILGSIFGVFSFDAGDFSVNRSGCLSDKQRARLAFYISFHFISAFFIFVMAVGVIWAYFAALPNIPVLVCLIWSMGLLCFGVMWMAAVWPLVEDYHENKVLQIHSTITIKYIGGGGSVRNRIPGHFRIRAAGKSFDSLWFSYSRIIERQIYRVYYIPHSKIIVGLEEI